MKVRTRIAPSPTGFFHIGNARTALFNYLFTKKNNGKFILRIEDTDLERSDIAYEKDIIDGLRWLGLDWDEGPEEASSGGGLLINKYKGDYGPYRQSERLEIYKKYLQQLLDKGYAYYCYCTKEELEIERQAMLSQGLPPKYSGHCLLNDSKEKRDPQLIRFRMPDKKVSFKDIVRGEISFQTGILGDIAIAKNLTSPLYNFAVVIDDQEMQITHVVRGEDHIPNTPKQILLIEALDFNKPHYAHLPLILDPDRSKMSKRFSATAINEYRDQGYLPEALINFMALLGWHPASDSQEILSLVEIIEKFDLKKVQKAGAVFNIEKLNWINSQYLKKLDDEKFLAMAGQPTNEQNLKLLSLLKNRLIRVGDFKEQAELFYNFPDYQPQLLLWKNQSKESAIANLEEVKKIINNTKAISEFAEKTGRGEVFWPLRVALSGLEASPGPLELLDVLEKEEAVRRINIAIEKLK
jgi:glutamyl-tRNA synthetase